MGITVDRCQGKQGENDKSQQDESYFKVCERQLHELLLLHLGKSANCWLCWWWRGIALPEKSGL